MEHYDTIIIGAGLAGCTLGNLLLRKNKKVIIIENKDLSKKDKLCGGIITTKAYKLLLRIYGKKIENLNFKKFDNFKVKNNGVTKEIKNQNIFTIYRKELDDFVVSEFLSNGGIILDNTNYDKIDFKRNIVYISNKVFKYNNLVGADGIFSKVRKGLTNKQQRMNFAVESKCEKSNNVLEIDFLDYFKGYAWIIPNNNYNIIGLGDVSKNIKITDKFAKYFNLDNNVNIRGAFLPTGDDILMKKSNTYLIGDAAGFASPVIGEGIYYALSSAYNLSTNMNIFYRISMIKDMFIIFTHRISKSLIYNTTIRNFFYKFYGKSKVITLLINLALKSFL